MITRIAMHKYGIFSFLLLSHLLMLGSKAGVIGLTKFFRKRGGSAWKAASSSKVLFADHLCIDMNQLIHISVRSKDKLVFSVKRIFHDLDNLLKYVVPMKSLVLVFDGPAPFAKLQTQRNRRMSTPENNIITPGTDFMALMETYMLGYVFQRIYRFNNISVYISGANSPGEGEVKIIDWSTTHIHNKNDTLVICGADSDILLQAMMLSEISSISVLQGGSAYSTAFCNISAMLENLSNFANLTDQGENNKRLHPKYLQYLENKAVANEIGNSTQTANTELTNTTQPAVWSRSTLSFVNKSADYLDSVPPSFRLDIIILFLLQGNDYLPKMRGVTIEKTLAAYGKVIKSLPKEKRYLVDVERNSFNFVTLYLLMEELRSESVQVWFI